MKLSTDLEFNFILSLASTIFKNKVDRQNVPYVQHGYRVSQNELLKDNPIAQYAALLHDVIEDTFYTAEQLINLGVPKESVDLITILTHKNFQPYSEYILDIVNSGNIDAIKIKLADIEDNTLISRNYCEVNQKSIIRRHLKYIAAYRVLKETLDGQVHNNH